MKPAWTSVHARPRTRLTALYRRKLQAQMANQMAASRESYGNLHFLQHTVNT